MFLAPLLKAEELPVAVVLFKGDVYLLDKDKRKHEATVGQEIMPSEYPWVETGMASALYLQAGNKLVELHTAGTFRLSDLFKRQSHTLEKSLLFLKNLASPRSFITQARVRGDEQQLLAADDIVFEKVWQRLVTEDGSSEHPELEAEELLAAAAWYQQQQRPARVAYILEKLNGLPGANNLFYKQLRIESLQHVTINEINQEVDETRKAVSSRFDPGRHMALLIGINEYDDASWQRLQTPLHDVNELKTILIRDYLFEETDVVVLENPGFEEIITAFNEVRQTSDETTNLFIYYAGHGYYPPGEDEGYWIPSDAGDPSTQRLFIPTSTILSKIKSIESKHTLVIADSCFSGSLVRKTRGAEIHSRYYRDLSTKKSRQIITSGGLEPVSDQGWGNNSIFAGKLIDILSRKRTEPMSASELALNLRKEVKNANADQTPEYGRLFVADDESGEFFFVRKDQKWQEVAQQSNAFFPEPGFYRQQTETEQGFAWEIVNKNGYRLNVGLGLQMAVLDYKFSYEDSNGEKRKISDSSTLSGTIVNFGLRHAKERLNLELVGSFGQMSGSSFECEAEDEQTEFCSKYAESSVSGQYTAAGVFADYSVLPQYKLGVELGGGLLLQRYLFNKLLDERNLDTSFVSACARAEINYMINNWFIGERNEFCFRVYQVGGSLSEFESDSLSDLQIPFNMKFNLVLGYRF